MTLPRAASRAAPPRHTAEPILAVSDLVLGYRGRPVLEGVSLEVRPGELVGLIGPNGSGKSTLLKGISGTLRPTGGRVLVGGREVASLGRGRLARLLAVVPQSPNLPEDFTALDIVLMGRAPHLGILQTEGARDLARVRRAMQFTDTLDLADRSVGELSGGERQRLVVARALAQEPSLLLLDEPTSHLDVHHQVQVMEILRAQVGQGLAALAVFHDLNLAAQFCDRLLLLYRGRIVAAGAPEEVITAEHVARVYGPGIVVARHPTNGRPTALVAAESGLPTMAVFD